MNSIETLVQQLNNSADIAAQISAAEQLATYAEEAQPAIVALIEYCGTDNEDLCSWCTAALESVGPPADEQIEALTELARSTNTNIAFWAVTLLGRAGSAAESARPALIARSEDASDSNVQKRASWALKKIDE